MLTGQDLRAVVNIQDLTVLQMTLTYICFRLLVTEMTKSSNAHNITAQDLRAVINVQGLNSITNDLDLYLFQVISQ